VPKWPLFGTLQRRLLAVVLVALAPIVTLSGVNLALSARQQRSDQLPDRLIEVIAAISARHRGPGGA